MFGRVQKPDWTGDQPRAFRWGDSKNPMAKLSDLIGYRKRLDALKAEHVLWTPYGAPIPQQSLYHGCLRYLGCCEAYMPDRVSRQFGRVQAIPTDVIRLIKGTKLSEVARSFKKVYESIHGWTHIRQHLFTLEDFGDAATTASTATPEYLEWHASRTHPRVSNPEHGEAGPTNTTVYETFQQTLGPIREQAHNLSQQASQDPGIPGYIRQGVDEISRLAGTGGYAGIQPTSSHQWYGSSSRWTSQQFTQDQTPTWYGYPGFQQGPHQMDQDDEE